MGGGLRCSALRSKDRDKSRREESLTTYYITRSANDHLDGLNPGPCKYSREPAAHIKPQGHTGTHARQHTHTHTHTSRHALDSQSSSCSCLRCSCSPPTYTRGRTNPLPHPRSHLTHSHAHAQSTPIPTSESMQGRTHLTQIPTRALRKQECPLHAIHNDSVPESPLQCLPPLVAICNRLTWPLPLPL